MSTEEELQHFLEGMRLGPSPKCVLCGRDCRSGTCRQCSRPLHRLCGVEGSCSLCHRAVSISAQQAQARAGLIQQANKMLRTTQDKFPAISVGDNVTVSLPRLDRASCDPRNILAVVLEVAENGLYRVGNRDGTMNRLVARNQIALTKEKFIRVEEVPDTEMPLRTLSTAASHSGGQGYQRCSCKTGCTHRRCACLSKKEKCKSHCHQGTSCANK
ncbi:hypothetical protein ONE63_003073 [Megalurothrips usitatus]|uniref:Uncharacterized protein n=1 Tax=Megalurothrips usitatus TaxID=439358 RepID=A0AAV7X666_9NEOP|nr:hypothetical protein ONE63_003073 [Megalurothrips usitatus]